MGTYQYTMLIPDSGTIRLMTLLPGAFDDDIRITLKTSLLATWYKPTYEALSYTWGSPQNPVSIFVGASGDATLLVTQDLATALRYLRELDGERVLWIDAVCVNQHDLEERGRQVQRMADIYIMAARVVLWLGPGSHDSAKALSTMQFVSSQIDVDWLSGNMKPSSQGNATWADFDKRLQLHNDILKSLTSLFNRSWFKRLLIWQEASLNENTLVLCGNQSLGWKSLRDNVFCCLYKLTTAAVMEPSERAFDDSIRKAWMVSNGSGIPSLIDCLEITSYCDCSDPRDRIYAL